MDHATAHVLLVVAGVALSMAGQLLTAALFAWTARAVGEEHPVAIEYTQFIVWPVALVCIVGAWTLGCLVALAAALFDLEPPDDDAPGGAA